MKMGRFGNNQLGFRPFQFVTDVVPGDLEGRTLTPGYHFRALGCYEFLEESVAGINWFRWLPFVCQPVTVNYRMIKECTVWVIAPAESFEEAQSEFVKWVEERDLDTHEETSFTICLHEGFTVFQGAVAWWSLSDATIITLQEDVAKNILASLEAEHKAFNAPLPDRWSTQAAK